MTARILVAHQQMVHTPQGYQRGITMIELMISLTIGLIILVALGQLFVTSRATYTMEEGLSRTQEAGRFAMEYLMRDIRMAGYAGCNNPATAGNVCGNGQPTTCMTSCGGTGTPSSFCNMVSPANDATRFAPEGIRGYTYTGNGTSNNLSDWTPALPPTFFVNGDVLPNTDVILIQYALSTNTYITDADTSAGNANVKVANNSALNGLVSQGSVLVISNCLSTDVFKVTNNVTWDPDTTNSSDVTFSHGSNNNASSHLTHDDSYAATPDTTEILLMTSKVYYIGSGTGGEPALFTKELVSGGGISPTASELVQGVENMRMMFGVDFDVPPITVAAGRGTANRYARAHRVVDLNGAGSTTWGNVVSIRIGLLIRTPGTVDESLDTRSYELVDGVTIDPVDDRRRRQAYRATVQLRNSGW